MQSSLNQVLATRLPVNGIMDPATRAALRNFQQRNGLPPDGIAGPETERALMEAKAGPANRAEPAQERETWGDVAGLESELESEINRKSPAYLRWVQHSLNRILGLNLAVDGRIGRNTRNAIRRFQMTRGLAVDGIVGRETERALVRAGATPPGSSTPTVRPRPAPSRPSWIEWVPSPYHGSRSAHPVTAIIYHFTAGPTLEGTVRYFGNNERSVSSHYVVGKDGRTVQMVPLDRAAYHAGRSALAGCRGSVNYCSVGIEIVNWGMLNKRGTAFYTHSGRRYTGPPPIFVRGRYWEPFTAAQYASLIRLTKYLLSAAPGVTHIVGHEDIAPGRKNDPGGAFDWARVAAALRTAFGGHIGRLPAARRETRQGELPVESETQASHSYLEVDEEKDLMEFDF